MPFIPLQLITVAYSQTRAAMFEGSGGSGGPLQRLRFEARSRFTLLGAGAGGVCVGEAGRVCSLGGHDVG